MAADSSIRDSDSMQISLRDYGRLLIASQREIPNLLQELLEYFLPSNEVYSRCMPWMRKLTITEIRALGVAKTAGYKQFDSTLVYKLLRWSELVPPPSCGWGCPRDPAPRETTIGDDVERLRLIRNRIINKITKVTVTEFSEIFLILKEIAKRFEITLHRKKNELVSRFELLETCHLDNANFLEGYRHDNIEDRATDYGLMLLEGEYSSYENRIFLVGPCKAGKTTLAMVLTGGNIETTWISTNVLSIYFGKIGIILSKKEMVCMEGNTPENDIFQKLKIGNPKINQDRHTHTEYQEMPEKGDIKITAPVNDHSCTFNEKPTMGPFDIQARTYEVDKRILDAIRRREYSIEIAPGDIVDFGGQDAFDMIHQLFISQRGTFCFLFDGNKNLLEPMLEHNGKSTADLMQHWINSILTYCSSSNRGFPKVVFAASHSDNFRMDKIDERRHELVGQIDELFAEHPLRHHLVYEQLPFIDTRDQTCQELNRLKKAFVDIAFSQPTWGEPMPIKWAPLQLSLSKLRQDGKFIISREQLEEINALNGDLALDLQQMHTFLEVQHSLGKLMYINDISLNQFIILDPSYMVTVLRSFLTDKEFFPADSSIRSILENMQNTGKIRKHDLFQLWEQEDYKQLLPFKDFLTGVLIRLDILTTPQRYLTHHEEETVLDYFLVPCMVQRIDTTSYMNENCTDERSICLSYKFRACPVPSAVAFRLFGACLCMWNFKEYKGVLLLFRDSVTLIVDKNHELSVRLEESRINVYLIHSKSKRMIVPNVASTIQECISITIEKILLFYMSMFGTKFDGTSLLHFETQFKVICGQHVCFAPGTCKNFTPDSKWICQHGTHHEVKYLLNWFPSRVNEECGKACLGLSQEQLLLCPSNVHLRRLVTFFIPDDFKRFMMRLNLPFGYLSQTLDQYHYNLTDAMFVSLWTWRCRNIDCSFQRLQTALRESKLSSHILCETLKEEPVDIEGIQRNNEPPEELFRELSKHIGIQVMQLGIELGLDVPCIEDIQYRHRYLPEQAYAVLMKWKQMTENPTVRTLAMALKHIQRGTHCLVDFYRLKECVN